MMAKKTTDTNPDAPTPAASDPVRDLRRWWGDAAGEHRVPLLLEACARFGIDPDPGAVPRQLLAVAGYGDPAMFEPDRVVLVTAGGMKLEWPISPGSDCEQTLLTVFQCRRTKVRPGTVERYVEVLPLPASLVLPAPMRTGIPPGR